MSFMIRILSSRLRKSVRINSQLPFVRTITAATFPLPEEIKVVAPYFISSSCPYQIGSHLSSVQLCKPLNIQKRDYAKGKDKKGSKKKESHITDDELAELINLEDYRESLEGALENLKDDYLKHLSIRTQAGSLESIPIELEGDTYPLGEVAQIIRKSATSIIINASAFPQATSNIKKAIEESGMNLNVQQEGTTFYVPIPKVTKEHREGLAQNAKMLFEKTKTHLREIQNRYIKIIKSKEGQVSDDLIFNGQLKVQEMTREFGAKAELMMKNKQNELLKTTK